MTTYRDIFPTEHICHDDLKGRDAAVTIKSIDFDGKRWIKGRRERAIVLYFEGKDKGLCVNASIYDTIAFKLGYGRHMEDWVGKRITIYPATDEKIRSDDKTCVRVRPTVPPAPRAKAASSVATGDQAERAPEQAPAGEGRAA